MTTGLIQLNDHYHLDTVHQSCGIYAKSIVVTHYLLFCPTFFPSKLFYNLLSAVLIVIYASTTRSSIRLFIGKPRRSVLPHISALNYLASDTNIFN